MKFFFLMNDKPGGAEQVLKEIVLQSLENQLDVMVCFLLKRSCGYWDDCKIYPRFQQCYLERNPGSLIRYRGWFNEKVSRVYTTHVYITGLMGILMTFNILKKKEFVGRESTSIFMRYKGLKLMSYLLCYKLGYKQLSLLICQTQLMKDQLVKRLPSLDQKVNIQVIPNPINLNKGINAYPLSLDAQVTTQKFIVSAGRLIPEKGFDILVEAFACVKHRFPNLKLVILGEGGERESLNALVAKLKLSSDVIMPGFTPDVYQYFKAAKVCVVSSRLEGFPNVLLQMMSQNDKVVSTRCAGGIDQIQGLFLAETTASSLAQNILKCIDDDSGANSVLFKKFLEQRSVDRFVGEIEKNLNVKQYKFNMNG